MLDAEQRCRGRKHRAISDSVRVEAGANRLRGSRRTANPHKHANDDIPRMPLANGRGQPWVNLAPIDIRHRQPCEEQASIPVPVSGSELSSVHGTRAPEMIA